MIETVSLSIGSSARPKPTAAELAAALQLSEVPDAAAIIANSWAEVESYARCLWGSRTVVHTFRVLSGGTAEAVPGYLPVPESVTLERWNGKWEAAPAEYAPDGVLRDLTQGALYRATVARMGHLGNQQRPKAVCEAVLRLSAWRASHRGGMFLPLDRPTLAGYAAVDGIRRSGAAEVLAPYLHGGA